MGSIMGLSAVKDFANSTTAKVAVAGAIALSVFGANAQTTTYPFFVHNNPNNPSSPQCHDQGKVMAAIKEDGQLEIAAGRRFTDNGPYNIITMNTKGYMYNFEQQRTSNGLELCLRFKAKAGIVDDSPTRPSWTRNIGVNGNINPDEFYKKGGRIWAGAHGFSLSSTGTEIPGQLVAVTASQLDERDIGQTGVVWMINNKGTPSNLLSLNGIKINTQNIRFLMNNGLGPLAEASTPADNGSTSIVAAVGRTPSPR